MYIGSTGSKGLHHLIWEILDNSIDEVQGGHAKVVDVAVDCDSKWVTVRDDGRGIPTDVHEATGKSALETVLTVLHAGGKFGTGGYSVSGGLHGVGLSVVNALSEALEVLCSCTVLCDITVTSGSCRMHCIILCAQHVCSGHLHSNALEPSFINARALKRALGLAIGLLRVNVSHCQHICDTSHVCLCSDICAS
jgi:hypothetical protein